MIRLIIFIIIFLVFDFYAFQSVRTLTKNSLVALIYFIISLFSIGNIIYQSLNFDRSAGINSGFYFAFALLVLVFIPKLILISFMFGEDVFRFFEGFLILIFQKIIQLTVLFLMGEENLLVRLHLELQQFPFCQFFMVLQKGNIIIKY